MPTWSNSNSYELAFIWYVCMVGGVVPAVLMLTINFYVVFNLNDKVSLINAFKTLIELISISLKYFK